MSLLDDLHTSYKWILSNCENLLATGNLEIKSETFTLVENQEIEWCLVLKCVESESGVCHCSFHGRWNCVQNRDRIFSLYLQNCKSDKEPVLLNVDFSILNADRDKVFTRKEKIAGVIVNGQKYGFDKFISETVLFSNLLVDKGLIILCEIKPINEGGSGNLLFLKGFDASINDETFSDAVLFLDEKKIYAHKMILSSRSPVFRQMFLTNMKESNSNEARVKNIRIEVFNELLRFMYTGKVEKLNELCLDIFRAAHFYQIDDLTLICENVLRKTLKIENSIDILKLSDEYDAESLKKYCVVFIMKNFKAVMKTPSYLNLYKTHPHLPFELLNEMGAK
ncbi:speckle-type POZ protein-like isoform X2 [Belonocnema kinseyi]|nr:speckle-type POZ protein-like isoform X2 [Belonocnema kinseyi]